MDGGKNTKLDNEGFEGLKLRMCTRWVHERVSECCECYRREGGADTEVSGKRYPPPAQQFQMLRYETSFVFLYSCSQTRTHALDLLAVAAAH